MLCSPFHGYLHSSYLKFGHCIYLLYLKNCNGSVGFPGGEGNMLVLLSLLLFGFPHYPPLSLSSPLLAPIPFLPFCGRYTKWPARVDELLNKKCLWKGLLPIIPEPVFFFLEEVWLFYTFTSYTMVCMHIQCDNAGAIANALSHIHGQNHGITDLSHLHACRSHICMHVRHFMLNAGNFGYFVISMIQSKLWLRLWNGIKKILTMMASMIIIIKQKEKKRKEKSFEKNICLPQILNPQLST